MYYHIYYCSFKLQNYCLVIKEDLRFNFIKLLVNLIFVLPDLWHETEIHCSFPVISNHISTQSDLLHECVKPGFTIDNYSIDRPKHFYSN